MMSRLALVAVEDLQSRFGIAHSLGADLLPRMDIAPPQALCIVVEAAGSRCLRSVRWGFRPPWFVYRPSEPSITAVRAESLPRQVTFHQALRQARCVIPADGIAAWQRLPGQRVKQSVTVRRRDGGLFGIAGLYTEYVDERSGQQRASCALITTAPNALFAPLDPRMPAILQPADEAVWLRCSSPRLAEALACLQPAPVEELELVSVAGVPAASRLPSRNDRASDAA